jgi:hypothetical protein
VTIEHRYNGGVPQDPDREHFLDDDGHFDVVRFVLQTTHEVWDEQRFDRISDYFAEDFVSYGAEGREFGDLQELFDYALPRTAAFPDTRVFVDDLLWTGDEEDGFRTSHSFTVTGTNTGRSRHGPPTGKRLRLTGIANCRIERVDGRWQYTEERAEDDQFAILRACTPGEVGTYPELPDHGDANADETASPSAGVDEPTASGTAGADGSTASPGADEGATDGTVPGRPSSTDRAGDPDDGIDPAEHLAGVVHEVWNERSVGAVERHYAEDVVVEAASGRRLRDVSELRTEVLERLGAFPDLELTIDDVLTASAGSGYDSSIAYTATGTHAGPSRYGTGSGRSVTFTGLCNQKLRRVGGDWRIVHVREDLDERRLMRLLR